MKNLIYTQLTRSRTDDSPQDFKLGIYSSSEETNPKVVIVAS